jgi:hypothetical protein
MAAKENGFDRIDRINRIGTEHNGAGMALLVEKSP